MIQTCIIGVTNDTLKMNDENGQLSSNIEATKLKKLQQRMSYGVDIKTSQFVDEEIFFYEFIVNVKNASFERFLKLVLIEKIYEYNNLDHFVTDYQEQDLNQYENQLKAGFSTHSLTLQILAKFLGFIEFSTFQTSLSPKSHQFIETQIKLRQNEYCPLNIVSYLQDSLDNEKLSLTLPWVLQFLRQMDPIAPHLYTYQNILAFIFKINQDLQSEIIECETGIRLYLFLLLKSFICDYQSFIPPKIEQHHSKSSISKSPPSVTFDKKVGLIDTNFVLESSSIVQSINWSHKKRSQFKTSKVTTPRKITPVTIKAESPTNSGQVSFTPKSSRRSFESSTFEDPFQKEFENHFYSLHPISLKKVIEFVSERIFSKCIKELKSQHIHEIKKPFLNQINNQTTISEEELNQMIQQIQAKCSQFVHNFCQSEINLILSLLLSSRDHSPMVIKYSNDLATSSSTEKCCKWIQLNINQDWILNELKSNSYNQVSEKVEKIPSFSKTFMIARDYIYSILIGRIEHISKSDIIEIITQLTDLRKHPTISEKTQIVIDLTINDLMIAFISKRFIYQEEIMKNFINYYQSNRLQITNLVCPRNIYILCQSSNPDCWNIFETLIIQLLNKHILSYSHFEETCLSALQYSHEEKHTVVYFLDFILGKLKSKQKLSKLSNLLSTYWDQCFPKLT